MASQEIAPKTYPGTEAPRTIIPLCRFQCVCFGNRIMAIKATLKSFRKFPADYSYIAASSAKCDMDQWTRLLRVVRFKFGKLSTHRLSKVREGNPPADHHYYYYYYYFFFFSFSQCKYSRSKVVGEKKSWYIHIQLIVIDRNERKMKMKMKKKKKKKKKNLLSSGGGGFFLSFFSSFSFFLSLFIFYLYIYIYIFWAIACS